MQKHPGGRASTQECKMKDTDLADFGRKYPKKKNQVQPHASETPKS